MRVDPLQMRVDSVQTRVDPIQTRIDPIQASVGAVEPHVDDVEAGIVLRETDVEAGEELPLEVLEEGKSQGLVRHGLMLLLSIDHRLSDVGPEGVEGRKGRERPAAKMVEQGPDSRGPSGQCRVLNSFRNE